MKNTRKGFTLVELIVVITILAILGSIAFVSLQGYSADARNSKRTSDINSLQNAMSVKSTEGVSLLSFADNNSQLTNINVGGTWAIAWTDYKAWDANYSALGIKEADFQDPLDNEGYKIGVTTKKLGQYQVAASIEQGSGNRVAKVIGNYSPRGTTTIWTLTGQTLTLTDAQVNSYFAGDIIAGGWRVISISADGKTVTLVNSTGSTAGLALAETAGLIGSFSAGALTDIPVEENTSALPY